MNTEEEEKNAVHLPDLRLAQHRFTCSLPDEIAGVERKASAKEALLEAVREQKMAPFYAALCEELGWKRDDVLFKEASLENARALAEFEEKIVDAEENLGESEVREALQARAHHLCRIGAKSPSVSALEQLLEKTVGVGGKLDVALTLIRVGLFWNDDALTERSLKRAHQLMAQGGDWDRRNRLRDHEAAHLLRRRDFRAASVLLLDTLSTFNSYELFAFRDFVKYTVVAGMLCLDRVKLKEKLLEAPEVLSVLNELVEEQALPLGPFMNALYDCDYAQFFTALAKVSDVLRRDQYLAPHARFYCREMRIAAYAQKLQSYRSVQLAVMANDFGVTPEFLDAELSRFINLGRLPCKIDKVASVIETTRENALAAQYASTIKQGDALLTSIQKLSRVINA